MGRRDGILSGTYALDAFTDVPGCQPMTRPCILGIDPGISGAVAFYYPLTDIIDAQDVPLISRLKAKASQEIDAVTLTKMIRSLMPITAAFVESVHSMPKQGVASSFVFGESFGVIKGVLAALEIPVYFVSPQRWKKFYGISADKEAARALAIRLWPQHSEMFKLKKHHGRAEAALIAYYGRGVLNKQI